MYKCTHYIRNQLEWSNCKQTFESRLGRSLWFRVYSTQFDGLRSCFPLGKWRGRKFIWKFRFSGRGVSRWRLLCDLLCESPGHVLQHLPGSKMGSSHVGFGHSFLMFRHWTRATILLFFCTFKKKEDVNKFRRHFVATHTSAELLREM
jgi:hypothetical protein